MPPAAQALLTLHCRGVSMITGAISHGVAAVIWGHDLLNEVVVAAAGDHAPLADQGLSRRNPTHCGTTCLGRLAMADRR
jgi:hypothetical protein